MGHLILPRQARDSLPSKRHRQGPATLFEPLEVAIVIAVAILVAMPTLSIIDSGSASLLVGLNPLPEAAASHFRLHQLWEQPTELLIIESVVTVCSSCHGLQLEAEQLIALTEAMALL